MAFSRRTLSIVTVTLIVSLLGAGVWWRLRPSDAGEGEAEAAEVTGDAAADLSNAVDAAFSTDVPQPVTGATVVRDTLWVSVNAAGRADAASRVMLQAQLSGVVEAVRVRENNAVARGAPLLQIDTTEYALNVAQAESELRNAQAQYQQAVLFDDRIQDPAVRQQRAQIARSRSGLDRAEVALRQANLQLERSRVVAPFEGRIADVRVVPGQHVSAGTELMTVVDLDPIKVEVNVLEAELSLLNEGARSVVRFTGFPGETFEGRIATVNPVVDPEKRTGRVTVLLANPGGRIKPGMYAEVSLAATSFPDRLLVPREAILERGEGTRRTMLFVYEQDGGVARARWRYVLVGHMNDRQAEIIPSDEGTVEPGEIVLVNGHHYLSHDTVVRLVDNVAVEGGRPGG
jgi:membrane fusion protein (multidrug efflux system)